MSIRRVVQTTPATPSTGDGFGLVARDLSCSSIWSSGYARQKLGKQCVKGPLQVQGGCIGLKDGGALCDTLVWNGTKWVIGPSCSGSVDTVYPIIGDGSVLNPVQISKVAVSGEGVYFVPNAWGIYQNPGATTVTVGGASAMYSTIQNAFTDGSSFIRVISDVTETSWSLAGLSASQPILVYIDMGVTYSLTGTVNLGPRDITLLGAGESSEFKWNTTGTVFFTAVSGRVATFGDLTLFNASGVIDTPLVDVVHFVVRMSGVHVNLGPLATSFLGLATSDAILDTEILNTVVTTAQGGNVIVGSSTSRLKITGLSFDGSFTITGTAVDVQSPFVEISGFSRLVHAAGSEIYNLRGTIIGFTDTHQVVTLNLGTGGTLVNAEVGILTVTGTNCLCSSIVAQVVNIETQHSQFSEIHTASHVNVGIGITAQFNQLCNCEVGGNFIVGDAVGSDCSVNNTIITGARISGDFIAVVATAGFDAIGENCVFSNINATTFILGIATGAGAFVSCLSSQAFGVNVSGNAIVANVNSAGGSIEASNVILQDFFVTGHATIATSGVAGGSVTFSGEISDFQLIGDFTVGVAASTDLINISSTVIDKITLSGSFIVAQTTAAATFLADSMIISNIIAQSNTADVGLSGAGSISMQQLSFFNFLGDTISFFTATGGTVSSNQTNISGITASEVQISVCTAGSVTTNFMNLSNFTIIGLIVARALGGSVTANGLQVTNMASNGDEAIIFFDALGGDVTSIGSNLQNFTLSDTGSSLTIGLVNSGSEDLTNLQIGNINSLGNSQILVSQGATTLTANNFHLVNVISQGSLNIMLAESGSTLTALRSSLSNFSSNGAIEFAGANLGTLDASGICFSGVATPDMLTMFENVGGTLTANSIQGSNVSCLILRSHRSTSVTGGALSSSSTVFSNFTASGTSMILQTMGAGLVTANGFSLTNSSFFTLNMAILNGGTLANSNCSLTQTGITGDLVFARNSTANTLSSTNSIFSDLTVAGHATINSATNALGTVDTSQMKMSNGSIVGLLDIGTVGAGTMFVTGMQVVNSQVGLSPTDIFGDGALISNCKFLEDGHLLTFHGLSAVAMSTQVGVQGGALSLITFAGAPNLSTAFGCYQNSAAFGVDPDRPSGVTLPADVNFFSW